MNGTAKLRGYAMQLSSDYVLLESFLKSFEISQESS
jgi:hypothetical protein